MSRSFDESIETPFFERLTAARQSESELGRLLQSCRDYLLLVANEELPADVRRKIAPSDIVQETFVEAHDAFARFPGVGANEFRAWMKRILLNNTKDAIRHYRQAQKRDVAREQSLDAAADVDLVGIVSNEDSPSRSARRGEDRQRMIDALHRLPESYRRMIELRNLEQLTFVEIARRTQRSTSAVRTLWIRAIRRLANEMGPDDDSLA